MNTVLPVIGGLSLFLYGMNIMGDGLQKVAGRRLSRLIEVLTTNRITAVIVGILVTMIVQSSSATTVMVIGFVNANLMTLGQAVGIIMGANIGTTITAQMIALNLTDYAPIAVAIGIIMKMMSSKKNLQNLSDVFIGFGLLFIGMDMMGSGLKPLAGHPIFAEMLTGLNNPFLGAIAGFLLTTIVQSSSASIGLLQALAGEGLISIHIAFPILFGENIGTTTTAMLSSIGASVTAKRAALMHFLFNLIGTLLFITILRTPIEWLVLQVSPANVQAQIANAHTLFNITNMIIQLPFAMFLVRAVEKIVPGEDKKKKEASIYLDDRIIETPSIALGQANKEVLRMGDLVLENMEKSRIVFVEEKYDGIDDVLEREKLINKVEREITDYLVQLSNQALSKKQQSDVNVLLNIINDIERVGDHIENIAELAEFKEKNNLFFSEEGKDSLNEMFNKCEEVFTKAMEAFKNTDEVLARQVLVLEQEIDDLEKKHREDHMSRLSKMECQTEPGVIFLDSISNLERVSDHSNNIAMYVLDNFK